MRYKVFIVEDDPGIAGAVREQMALWDMESVIAENFREILTEFTQASPHIVLLDIALPFYNGYHWCSEIRRTSKVPILFRSSA